MKNDYLEVVEGLLDENSFPEYKALIDFGESEESKDIMSSENFIRKSEFLKELFTYESKQPFTDLSEDKPCAEESLLVGSDRVIIRGWKNVENISARLIDSYDDTIILECLIDKEHGIYEEREFRKSLFEGYENGIGSLYLLRIFERQNEIRIEIHNDPELTLKDDFQKLNFVEKFKDSRLFKKK